MTKSIFTAHYSRLCAYLIQARIDAGMSQAALAKCLNRPQSFVSKYESKQRRLDVVEFLELASCLHADGIDIMARLLDGFPNHSHAHRGVGLDGAQVLDGVKHDGVKPDRAKLDGVKLDGVKFDGVKLDGVKPDRVKLNGVKPDRAKATRRPRIAAPAVDGVLQSTPTRSKAKRNSGTR